MITPIPKVFTGWEVLVVEDELDSMEVATRLLQFAGASVATANNGKRALDWMAHHRPHFILSDLSMPEMDGWELIHTLKNDRRWLDIPVIALTAHAMSGDRERALAAGFHNYISKPLDPPKFIGQLMNILTIVPELAVLMEARTI
jgi:CheY-like chemotaxis protein